MSTDAETAPYASPYPQYDYDDSWGGWYLRGRKVGRESWEGPTEEESAAAVPESERIDPTAYDLLEHLRNAVFTQDRDGVWVVDCRSTSEWGTVGEGKSNIGIELAKELQQPPPDTQYAAIARAAGVPEAEVRKVFDDVPAFDPKWQIVYGDEDDGHDHFLELWRTLDAGCVIVWEEMADAMARRVPFQHRRPVVEAFQQNRKLGVVVLGTTPRVMDLDEYLLFDRIQKVVRMQNRTRCVVYVRNGFVNMRKDEWGHKQAFFDAIPKAYGPLWDEYLDDATAQLRRRQMERLGATP